MSNGPRLPLRVAEKLAEEVIEQLDPFCTRIQVVGSIRRRKEDVGDIELLVIPKLEPGGENLFGETCEQVNLLDVRVKELIEDGFFQLRTDINGFASCGPRSKRLSVAHSHKIASFSTTADIQFAVDLFSCLEPAQYGVLEMIRTGSDQFSRLMMTPRARGGFLPEGFKVDKAQLFNRHRLVSTPREQDFFSAIGKYYVKPEDRNRA